MQTKALPSYPAARALQWIGPPGMDLGVAPGWYPIVPVLPSDGRPWPSATPWPAADTYRPGLELMLQ